MLSLTAPANRASGDAEKPTPLQAIIDALQKRKREHREMPTSNELAREAGLGRTMTRRQLKVLDDQKKIRWVDSTTTVPCQRVDLIEE